MRVGNEEGMVKRGVGGPWKLDLVEGIEKQEMFEVGHLPHCSALKPQPIPPPISDPLGSWGSAYRL